MRSNQHVRISYGLFFIVFGIFISLSIVPSAHALVSIEWEIGGFADDTVEISEGNHWNGFPITVHVQDDVAISSNVDTIDVFVNSTSFPLGNTLTLIETGPETNEYEGEAFAFLLDPSYQIPLDATVTVQVEGDPDFDCNVDEIDMLDSTFSGDFSGVFVFSDTEVDNGNDGIGLVLTETGPNTCLFEGDITFTDSGSSDEDAAILLVSEGDLLTFLDDATLDSTMAQIIPTVPGKGSVYTEIGDIASVTYKGQRDDLEILDDGAPGRGGGGLVRPGLVVDAPSEDPEDNSSDDSSESSGSGCSGDCQPPTLGLDSSFNRIVENGFSYNGNPVNVESFYTSYPLITVQVGEQNKAVLKIYDNGGTQNIAHVELGFGIAKDKSFSENEAAIILDIARDGRESVTTFDPENVLDNVSVITKKEKCGSLVSSYCLVVIIDHTFREPLEFNMVGVLVWDHSRNSWQFFFNHGVHIVGDSLNPPKTKLVAFGTNEMKGQFTLTRIDKIEDKWIDAFGNVYLHRGNDHFILIETIPKEIIEDSMTMHGCDRMCNWFDKYKKNQEEIAHQKMYSILGGDITNEMPLFIPGPENTRLSRSENTFLQNNISVEIEKAELTFDKQYKVYQNFEFVPPSESIKLLKGIQDYQKTNLNNK